MKYYTLNLDETTMDFIQKIASQEAIETGENPNRAFSRKCRQIFFDYKKNY